MLGVVGTGQVAQHVIEHLKDRGILHYVFTRSPIHADGAGAFVSYTDMNLPDLLKEHKITSVINCAALRDINVCESKPQEAWRANVGLPSIIGDNVKQVYLSTDYVFDRNLENRVLDESARTNGALTIYGATKQQGEDATIARDGIVARISSPWGKYPSPMKPHFVDFAAMNTHDLDLPMDQWFAPTYLPDVVEQLVSLAQDTTAHGTYHLVGSGKTNWHSFAVLARQLHRNTKKTTGSVRNDKTRPTNGALVNTRLPKFRHWIPAMEEYFRGKLAEEGYTR